MKKIAVLSLFALVTFVGYAAAQQTVVEIRAAEPSGSGAVLGTVTITATPYGTLFTPSLSGLTPGIHGFHVHEHPSCAPMDRDGKPVASLGAGGHYDPAKTGKHLGPYGEGHVGDLPPLMVDAQGKSVLPLLAPRLKITDVKGRSLMVHAGGDNFSDQPEPLGGGGARIGCGVVN
jgi:Cu-Zn family superoxide dismutase